jgi:hypothetical protein
MFNLVIIYQYFTSHIHLSFHSPCFFFLLFTDIFKLYLMKQRQNVQRLLSEWELLQHISWDVWDNTPLFRSNSLYYVEKFKHDLKIYFSIVTCGTPQLSSWNCDWNRRASRERDYLYRLDPTEEVLPEDGDKIQSRRRCVFFDKIRKLRNVQKHNNFSVKSKVKLSL